ncbi:MAG: glucose-1-phosphate adenylyltransferase [Pseudomonadota bacterium]
MDLESQRLAQQTMAFVLAGGRGSRLMELTQRRAKPAVYFGGKNRIIDFALSNATNSGMKRIAVATQYKAHSLIRHLQRGWSFARAERNESLDILPASQQLNEDNWYRGTADAVAQNMAIIEGYGPKYIIILAGDHIYKQDYSLMVKHHVESGADVTVGCIEVPRMEATGFGVMHVDEHDTIIDFVEKPADPPAMPNNPDMALASMGIYVFETEKLFEYLRADAADETSKNDFGHNVIPKIVADAGARAVAHPFSRSCVRSENERTAYWRDVGTLDAYWQANMDLTNFEPKLDLYDREWPIWTYSELTPPAKFIHNEDGRRGHALQSMVSGGCIISGSQLEHCLLHRGVRVNSYSQLDGVIILPRVEIGRNVRLRKVVIDSDITIPEGLVVGEDDEHDAARFRRTEDGVCLITKAMLDALDS